MRPATGPERLERTLVPAGAAPAPAVGVAIDVREHMAPFTQSPSLHEVGDKPASMSRPVALQLVVPGHSVNGSALREPPERARPATAKRHTSAASTTVTPLRPISPPDATGEACPRCRGAAAVDEPASGTARSGALRSLGQRGSGFGPVAVTSRCGTQSSTCTKPSKRPSASSTTSKKERL